MTDDFRQQMQEDFGVCDECGALVHLESEDLHNDFHERIDGIYTMASRAANTAMGLMYPNGR